MLGLPPLDLHQLIEALPPQTELEAECETLSDIQRNFVQFDQLGISGMFDYLARRNDEV